MRKGLTDRILRGTAGTIMRQLINVFGQLVLLPIYLKYWGSELFGEWQILSAAVAYVGLLDFGMQTFAVNRMNQSYSRGDIPEFTRVFHTALYFSLVITGLGALLFGIGILGVPVSQWFHLAQMDSGTGRLVLLILCFQFATSLPSGVIGGVYRAIGEYSRDIFFQNIFRALVLGATAVLLISGAGVLVIALTQLSGLVGHVLFVQWDLRRRHPEVRIGLSGHDRKLFMTFIAPSSLFFLMQMSVALTLQGTTLLIGAFAGGAMVAVFIALRALANVVPQVAQAVGATLWPELTALEARQEYTRLRDAYIFASKLLLGFAVASGIFLLFSARDIVAWWTGGRIEFNESIMGALIAIQVCQTWYLASSVLLASSNNHKRLAAANLTCAATGLGIAGLIGWQSGPSFLLWGLVVAELAIPCWFVPYVACRLIKQDLGAYVRDVLGKGFVFGSLVYLVTLAVTRLPLSPGSIERIASVGAAIGIAAVAALFLFWLNRQQRQWAMSVLRIPSWVPVLSR